MPEVPSTEAAWGQSREGLIRFLRSRLPTEADAEDVLQDVFVRVHERVERLREVASVEAWVFGVARHAVADFFRSKGREPERERDAQEEPSGEPAPVNLTPYGGDHDVHDEVLSWLLPLVELLPEEYRQAVRLADVEGRPQREVADQLGLTLSGAKSRIQRGRARLGEILRACCEVEFGADGRAIEFRRVSESCGGAC